MHELLDAIALLFDTLLTPFASGSEPRKRWITIVGTVIAILGILSVLGLLAWAAWPLV